MLDPERAAVMPDPPDSGRPAFLLCFAKNRAWTQAPRNRKRIEVATVVIKGMTGACSAVKDHIYSGTAQAVR